MRIFRDHEDATSSLTRGGHKDINSTRVYLTITQELLQEASERFRAFAAQGRRFVEGDTP